MDNLEKVEKLVEKTGVDYAKAKEVLEANDWELLDAIIDLESQGYTARKSSASFDAASSADMGAGDETGSAAAKKNEIQVKESESYEYGKAQKKQERKEKTCAAKSKVRNFLVNNRLAIYNPQGHEVVKLQAWIAILLFLCTFWVTTIVILISFAFGYKYVLEGPELGKEGINRAVDAVRDTTYTIAKDLKDKHEEHKAAKNEAE